MYVFHFATSMNDTFSIRTPHAFIIFHALLNCLRNGFHWPYFTKKQ